MSACGFCKSPHPSFRCGECLALVYCSSECQKADWNAYHSLECIGVGEKRERLENEEMSPYLQAVLGNPGRLRELAYTYTPKQLVQISENSDTSTFGGLLNENNVFWYWVVIRLAFEDFNRQRNYKAMARELMRQWKEEEFGESYKVPENETEKMVEKATLKELKTAPGLDQFVYFYIARRFSRDYNRPMNYRWVFNSLK